MSCSVLNGEIVAHLGSSGCGQTSTLCVIAGFEQVSHGSMVWAGRGICFLPLATRNVALVFEGYSLYPTVTVRDNIAFAVQSGGQPVREMTKNITDRPAMLEILDIVDRCPSSISVGQPPCAALAQARIREADLYRLPEPMGPLAPQLRTRLRGRIEHDIKERGMTANMVTHDQTAANAVADKIAVEGDGELQHNASLDEISDSPTSVFTGTCAGEPPMNAFDAKAAVFEDFLILVLNDGSVVLVEPDCDDAREGSDIALRFDPEDLHSFDPTTGRAVADRERVMA